MNSKPEHLEKKVSMDVLDSPGNSLPLLSVQFKLWRFVCEKLLERIDIVSQRIASLWSSNVFFSVERYQSPCDYSIPGGAWSRMTQAWVVLEKDVTAGLLQEELSDWSLRKTVLYFIHNKGLHESWCGV